MKELHEMLYFQKELLEKLQWHNNKEIGNTFEGYGQLLTHDVKTQFQQTQKQYDEIVKRTDVLTNNIKEKLRTLAQVIHGLTVGERVTDNGRRSGKILFTQR